MKKRTLVFFVITFSAVCALVFNAFYKEAKNTALKKLNDEQVVHARQAALGIEDFFRTWTGILTSFAKMDDIINTDAAGKRYIKFFYEAHQEEIMSITRMDEGGTIIYTVPFSRVIGSNISEQKHVQEILKKHKPVISDVFKTVQGFDAVALHVPVFKGAVFKGTIAIVINFESLAKRYLDVIKIGETGYAWVISRDGTQLYSATTGFTGKSVFENYKAYPSIIAMVNDMLKGHEGAAEYTFDRIGDRPVGQIKKYAVYKPIQLGNTFWSIVVASAEQDVLSGLISFRNRLILIVGIIFLFGIVFSLLGARAWLIVKEEGKRKQAEEKIKEAKEEWERTFDSIVDPLMILDTNYRIVKANKAMAEALGKTPEETVGLTCYEHVHGMNNPKPECPHKKLLADGKPHMTEIYEDLLGGWFLASVSPLHDSRGNLTGSVHYARNITELKQAEEEIRKREDEMKQAQEVAHIGSWHLDVPGNELKWSDEVYRIFGIPFNMPLTYEAFLDRVHPEDRAYVDSCWKAALARQPYDIEHRIMVEGEVKWVHEKADLVFSQEGEPLSGVGIVQDISERKKAEDELKKYREHLEGLVKERTAELEAKITEIQRLNKLFIGRELDMIEIKKRIKELEKQTGSSSKD